MTSSAPSSGETNRPLVSVVIPAYRVTPFIAAALDSVFRQTFRDYEVIVVNDGCPDTVALEAAIAPYRHRVHYVLKENGGLASARNAGIRAARGALVALLDGDDEWLPPFLARQVAFLDAHPEYAGVCSDAEFFGDGEAGTRFMVKNPAQFPVSTARLLREEVVVMASAVVLRKAAVERAGWFDESLRRCEDFDLWIRMAKQGAVIGGQPEVLARYRRRPGSLSSSQEAMLTTALQVLDKTERDLALDPDEREALVEGRSRLHAELALHRAKVALLQGEHAIARREFVGTRSIVPPARWWVIRAALRLAPGLLASVYRRASGEPS